MFHHGEPPDPPFAHYLCSPKKVLLRPFDDHGPAHVSDDFTFIGTMSFSKTLQYIPVGHNSLDRAIRSYHKTADALIAHSLCRDGYTITRAHRDDVPYHNVLDFHGSLLIQNYSNYLPSKGCAKPRGLKEHKRRLARTDGGALLPIGARESRHFFAMMGRS
jgi:hypothetical protein